LRVRALVLIKHTPFKQGLLAQGGPPANLHPNVHPCVPSNQLFLLLPRVAYWLQVDIKF